MQLSLIQITINYKKYESKGDTIAFRRNNKSDKNCSKISKLQVNTSKKMPQRDWIWTKKASYHKGRNVAKKLSVLYKVQSPESHSIAKEILK